MPLVIPNNHANIKLTIQNTAGGLSARSSIAVGVKTTGHYSQAGIALVANIMRDALAPLLDTGWLLGPTHVNETFGDVLYSWDDTGTEAGTHASATYASPAVAFVVSKQTGLAGRKYRGRVYFPGVAESDVDEAGAVAGATVNAVTAAFEDLRTDLLADASVDDVVLFHDSETPGSVVPTPITAFTCRSIVGTMRPRQRR